MLSCRATLRRQYMGQSSPESLHRLIGVMVSYVREVLLALLSWPLRTRFYSSLFLENRCKDSITLENQLLGNYDKKWKFPHKHYVIKFNLSKVVMFLEYSPVVNNLQHNAFRKENFQVHFLTNIPLQFFMNNYKAHVSASPLLCSRMHKALTCPRTAWHWFPPILCHNRYS